MSAQTIADIIAKCDEIDRLTAFIKTLAGKAQADEWTTYDPGYTHVMAVYTSARTGLTTLVGELPE